jgi:hypothetical protein
MARKSGSADRGVQQRAKVGSRTREKYHDPNNECLTRWEREDARCQRFSKAGYDWVLGCKARAADRLRMCYRNGYKPDPNEPPEFDWIDIDPDDPPER